MRSVLFTTLMLSGLATAQDQVYLGLPAAGEYRALFQASKVDTIGLRVGALQPQAGSASATWTLRYDARSGALEARNDRAGDMPLIDAGFGQRLDRDGIVANVLRIGHAADPMQDPPQFTITTARGTRRIDTGALAEGGGLTLVDATLVDGFELRVALPREVSIDSLVDLSIGETSVVHLQYGGTPGKVVRIGGELLCARSGCERQAAFVAPGGAVGLRVETAKESTLRFEGWGNDCRAASSYVSVLADVTRREFHCLATFSDEAMRERSKGNIYTTFSNADSITIPEIGSASPYPSIISVQAFGGRIADVNVRLENVTHAYPDDLDILLVGPSTLDRPVILMSDACGPADIFDFDFIFDDEATDSMTDEDICLPNAYRPTNVASGDAWASPAPEEPYQSTLSEFDGSNPIGNWRLFVTDDGTGDAGSIPQGWSISVLTGAYTFLIPGSGTNGVAGTYPSQRNYAGPETVIEDVDLVLDGVTHSYPDDLDVLLVSPGGTAVVVLSDACGEDDIVNYFWRFDDEAPAAMSDDTLGGCNPFEVRPTNFGSGDAWPATAPAGPYGSTLSEFDGEDPRGNWRLYVLDDAGGDGGFLVSNWRVEVNGGRLFRDGFETP